MASNEKEAGACGMTPEEMLGEIERLRQRCLNLEGAHTLGTALIRSAQAEVEGWKNQAQEIAQSNADHVKWHREMEAEIERLRAPHSAAIHRRVVEQTLRAEKAECENERLRAALDSDKAGMYAAGLALQARIRALEEALRGIVDRLDHADKIGRPVDGLAVAMAHDARMALGDTSPFARAALVGEGKQ
jgi:hypothetical protein